MIDRIVASLTPRYGARMRIAAIRLLALVAVMMMPFGMAAAPAEAAVQHHPAASMTAEHCPDGQTGDESKGGVSGCAMPCASALPASFASSVGEHPVARTTRTRSIDQDLAEIEIDIATPPPKLS